MINIIFGVMCIGVGLLVVIMNLENAEEEYTEDYERWA